MKTFRLGRDCSPVGPNLGVRAEYRATELRVWLEVSLGDLALDPMQSDPHDSGIAMVAWLGGVRRVEEVADEVAHVRPGERVCDAAVIRELWRLRGYER
jgi:hypothetical protein